jgi:5-formyltetrahydrofolate cyclo-ligase
LPEPDVDDSEMLPPEALDLVLAPLVVFDSNRNRIGMGGGFYDRSFAFRKNPEHKLPVLIGVAHELQKVDQIVPQEWDVRLDMIVTDRAVYR